MYSGMRLHLPEVDWAWAMRAFFAHFGFGFWVCLLISWLFTLIIKPRWFTGGFPSLLRVSFWGGVANNLIDLDHLSMLDGREYGRVWHIPMAGISGVIILIFLIFAFRSVPSNPCDRPGCPTCSDNSAFSVWSRRFGFAALMGVSVIFHVLEDYLVGAF